MEAKIYKLSDAKRAKAREAQRRFRIEHPEYESEKYRAKFAANPNMNKDAYWSNREKFLARARNSRMLSQFGISVADYDRMFERQDGLCAICHQPETVKAKGKVTRLAVDHSHYSGQARALLCNACNRLLAAAREKVETLESSINYLQYWDAMEFAPLDQKEA